MIHAEQHAHEPVAVDPDLDRTLGELSHILWRLRDLTSLLVYRLEVQQLMLMAGRVRWMKVATEDVEAAIEDVRRQELVRVDLVRHVAPVLGVAHDASLRDLCQVVPSPWDVVLAEHQSEFLTLAAEAEDAARDNRELLHQGLSEVQQFLDTLRGRPEDQAGESRYGRHAGGAGAAPAAAVLVDRDV